MLSLIVYRYHNGLLYSLWLSIDSDISQITNETYQVLQFSGLSNTYRFTRARILVLRAFLTGN